MDGIEFIVAKVNEVEIQEDNALFSHIQSKSIMVIHLFNAYKY